MNSETFTRRSLLAGATVAAAARGKAATDPLDWTLNDAADALAMGTISSEELTKLCLARIHKLDPALNAFITLDEESALEQAGM
jgi:aspartyl-tRNA(Asn)/glutamyl-tRNA(Gln) amidotransferase subunit A